MVGLCRAGHICSYADDILHTLSVLTTFYLDPSPSFHRILQGVCFWKLYMPITCLSKTAQCYERKAMKPIVLLTIWRQLHANSMQACRVTVVQIDFCALKSGRVQELQCHLLPSGCAGSNSIDWWMLLCLVPTVHQKIRKVKNTFSCVSVHITLKGQKDIKNSIHQSMG